MDQQTLWERMMKNQSSGTYDANLPPELNALVAGGQVEPQANPNFDPATLAQSQRAVINPGVQLASTMPFSAGNTSTYMARPPSPGTGRKNSAEQDIRDAIAKEEQSNPSLENQKSAAADYAKLVKAYADKPSGGFNNLDLGPLASLADAWGHTNIAKTYKAPDTVDERNQKMIGMQGNLAGLQGALTKEENELFKAKLAAYVGIDKANKDNSGMQTFMQERIDNMNHERNLKAVKSDPQLTKMTAGNNALTNALANYDNAETKAAPQFEELQNVIRRNLGINGVTDMNERKLLAFHNAGLDMARLKTYFFSKPEDVGESQEAFVDHLRNLVAIQQQNTAAQARTRINTLIKGNGSMYAQPQNQGRLGDLYDLANATADQFKPAEPPKSAAPKLTFAEYQAKKKAGEL